MLAPCPAPGSAAARPLPVKYHLLSDTPIRRSLGGTKTFQRSRSFHSRQPEILSQRQLPVRGLLAGPEPLGGRRASPRALPSQGIWNPGACYSRDAGHSHHRNPVPGVQAKVFCQDRGLFKTYYEPNNLQPTLVFPTALHMVRWAFFQLRRPRAGRSCQRLYTLWVSNPLLWLPSRLLQGATLNLQPAGERPSLPAPIARDLVLPAFSAPS